MNQRYIIPFLLLLAGCSSTESTSTSTRAVKPPQPESKYMRWVGDSAFDPQLDNDTFQLCYEEYAVKQYFNFGEGMRYQGEKAALEQQFTERYQPVDVPQSGWVRIRFIVNCKGETGRFRLTASDGQYQAYVFDERITDQLLAITQSLDGWETLPLSAAPEEYYQYLVFKIRNGNIEQIMP